MKIQRGDIYYIAGAGHEGDNKPNRPAVIVSGDDYNRTHNSVQVIYLTTTSPRYTDMHVTVKAKRSSTVDCRRLYPVAKKRIRSYVGTVTTEEMSLIDQNISKLFRKEGEQVQELQINYETEQPSVSARELHEGLGIKTQYTKWFERMTEYGFEENTDYKAISQKRLTAQGNETTFVDHEITLDMAKQICMLQRSEKGRQYRQHLIDLEKAWNTPEQVMARGLRMAEQKLEEFKTQNAVLIEDVERMKPKELFADSVASSDDLILIRDLAKILKQNGHDTGERRLIQWMKDNGYIIKNSSPPKPTQRAMELKLFRVVERTISTGEEVIVGYTTKVTGKGQQYFISKLVEG